MIFWPHNGDMTNPPSDANVKRRRPVGVDYWESTSSSRSEAIFRLRIRWMRETGEKCSNPRPKHDKRINMIRRGGGRRLGKGESFDGE